MTDADPSVVCEVEAFLGRHGADPARVDATGLRFLFDGVTTGEIDAALAELSARRHGGA